jgi:CRP/FNR family transcriptional regulator
VQESEELRPQLFERVCDEMAAAQDQMVLLSCKSAEERLCTFLLKHLRRAAAKNGVQSMVALPMTRQDMADYLGLTIETVSRTITKLTNKGVLGCVGRHSVKIIKPMLLAQLAGDDDEYGWGEPMGLADERRHH